MPLRRPSDARRDSHTRQLAGEDLHLAAPRSARTLQLRPLRLPPHRHRRHPSELVPGGELRRRPGISATDAVPVHPRERRHHRRDLRRELASLRGADPQAQEPLSSLPYVSRVIGAAL